MEEIIWEVIKQKIFLFIIICFFWTIICWAIYDLIFNEKPQKKSVIVAIIITLILFTIIFIK